MVDAVNAGVTSNVTAAVTGNTASAAAAAATSGNNSIAGNFTAFLQLLTTQLKNQNPLDPLDTNQFTQQLVQFAQVEQQLKSNDELATLVSLQQTAQQTQALNFVGATVAVDGSSANLASGQALWTLNPTKPATATFTITNATGQTVYTNSYTVQPGLQTFTWNGQGNDGTQWPDGSYKMSITGKDASGQSVAIPTEVDGTIDSVDLTQNPPVLSIGGQTFPLNSIKRIIKPTA